MLRTDWIKVGAAGKTIDGREITDAMIEGAAASYSQQRYTAIVNSEHLFAPGLGYVDSVRAAKDAQGRNALYVRVVPTAELLTRNQAKRQLFWSMELTPDFPEKGNWYLSGLAMTDMPASQGLAPTLFKAAEHPGQRYLNTAGMRLADGCMETAEPAELVEAAKAGESPKDEEPPGWFKSFLASISAGLRGGAISTDSEDAMTPEETKRMETLEANVAKLSEATGKLTEAVTKLMAPKREGDDPKPGEGDPAADAEKHAAGGEDVAKLVADSVAEALKPVNDKLAEVDAYMKQEVPPTNPAEVVGASAEQSGVWF